jgi:hypothetical protein
MMAEALPHGIAVASLGANRTHLAGQWRWKAQFWHIPRSQAFALNTHENPVVQPGLGQHGEAQSRSALALCGG